MYLIQLFVYLLRQENRRKDLIMQKELCEHKWVQGAEYWHNKTGENYDYLLPRPMKYHPKYQANCYICEKCGETITTIEEIEDGK